MSIFASHTQGTIPLLFDPPHTVTVRKLTGREVEAAQESHAQSIALGRSRVWAAKFRRILMGGLAADADVVAALKDPLTGYDRYALVRSGLIGWTYPESLTPTPATPGTAAVDAVGDLDDEALEFIARAVLKLTKPALFLTEEDAKAAQKELPAAAPSA